MDYTVHGILQARILEWAAFHFSMGLPIPRIKPRSPTLKADSLPAEPPGKPKKTGEDSLSLPQQIFLTQKSIWGLLCCRRIQCSRIDGFEVWCWRKLLKVPWTARRSGQSILKEINPEYSLEGLMLKLKHQYFVQST